jgi:hypothetical protein
MGAWGFGPLDNDGAQDWLHETLKKPIRKALRSKNPTVAFAALGLVAELGQSLGDVEGIDKAEATVLAEDASNWHAPSSRRRAIRRTVSRAKGETLVYRRGTGLEKPRGS